MADLSEQQRVGLLEALAVTAELTGTELSEGAARVIAADLAAYPIHQVLAALTRCRRELKGRLTIAAVIERLDDGRPGPNEAWAMIPQDEAGSVVWTTEMAQAFGIAHPLLREGQIISARVAFIERYTALVAEARAKQLPPRWEPSLGHDPLQHAAVLEDAEHRGRLTKEHVAKLLPPPESGFPLLNGSRAQIPAHVRQQLQQFRLKLISGGRKS